jgi:hypothetical protein
LIIPYILKEIIFAIVYILQKDILVIYGSIVLGGWAPLIPLTWYFTAWTMYFYFKIKYETSKRKKHTKIIAGVLLSISVVWGLLFVFNAYRQQEAKIILQCGSEKIFTKNLQPYKLYFTNNFISKNADSEYIGNFKENNIILKKDNYILTIRRLKDCLKYSDKLNLIYPKNSIYTKSWGWEKYIYDVNSTLIYNSKEVTCPSKRENYEYFKWELKHTNHNIGINKNGFVFDINNTLHVTKADTIELNRNYSGTTYPISYSINNKIYIFMTSIIDSSKVILWIFSKNGSILKEVHIRLPNNLILKAGKGYYISHTTFKKDFILFRIYEIYQGNQKQKWNNMCKYYTIQIKNI